MGIYQVEVDVALERPPKIDRTVKIVVEATDGVDAELLACQMAQARKNVVMAVASRVIDWSDDPHQHATDYLVDRLATEFAWFPYYTEAAS